MGEVWRDIVGYEGLYRVSNLGRVCSLPRINRQGHKLKGRILKPGSQTSGYLFVHLVDSNGVARTHRVHRLVAQMFIPNVMGYSDVDHKDTDKTNNKTTNLTWVTKSGNRNNPITYKKSADARRGTHLSDSTKKKLSQSNSGKNNPFYGEKHSEETKQRMRKAWEERRSSGYISPLSKKVVCIETGMVFNNSKEAATKFAGDAKNIKRCCNGKYHTSGGYHWQWYEEDMNNGKL